MEDKEFELTPAVLDRLKENQDRLNDFKAKRAENPLLSYELNQVDEDTHPELRGSTLDRFDWDDIFCLGL